MVAATPRLHRATIREWRVRGAVQETKTKTNKQENTKKTMRGRHTAARTSRLHRAPLRCFHCRGYACELGRSLTGSVHPLEVEVRRVRRGRAHSAAAHLHVRVRVAVARERRRVVALAAEPARRRAARLLAVVAVRVRRLVLNVHRPLLHEVEVRVPVDHLNQVELLLRLHRPGIPVDVQQPVALVPHKVRVRRLPRHVHVRRPQEPPVRALRERAAQRQLAAALRRRQVLAVVRDRVRVRRRALPERALRPAPVHVVPDLPHRRHRRERHGRRRRRRRHSRRALVLVPHVVPAAPRPRHRHCAQEVVAAVQAVPVQVLHLLSVQLVAPRLLRVHAVPVVQLRAVVLVPHEVPYARLHDEVRQRVPARAPQLLPGQVLHALPPQRLAARVLRLHLRRNPRRRAPRPVPHVVAVGAPEPPEQQVPHRPPGPAALRQLPVQVLCVLVPRKLAVVEVVLPDLLRTLAVPHQARKQRRRECRLHRICFVCVCVCGLR
eukprot:Rhum_TRINITY_DN15317_c0_g1::Rhum_TRINITY_DN15317_c0_g1_i3::g.151595::m.151595